MEFEVLDERRLMLFRTPTRREAFIASTVKADEKIFTVWIPEAEYSEAKLREQVKKKLEDLKAEEAKRFTGKRIPL